MKGCDAAGKRGVYLFLLSLLLVSWESRRVVMVEIERQRALLFALWLLLFVFSDHDQNAQSVVNAPPI